jgi:hypothetical protein
MLTKIMMFAKRIWKKKLVTIKKRSIIVSSIEEPIRKNSRNRKMNSFLTDFV